MDRVNGRAGERGGMGEWMDGWVFKNVRWKAEGEKW